MAGVRCSVVFVLRWVYSMQDRARRLYRCYARRRKCRFQEYLRTRVRRETQPWCRFPCSASDWSIERPLKPADVCAQDVQQLRAAVQPMSCSEESHAGGTAAGRRQQVQVCECRAAVRCRQGWRSVPLPLLYCTVGRYLMLAGPCGCQLPTVDDDRVAWGQGAWRLESESVKEWKGSVGRSDASSQSMCARRIFFTNRARQGVVAHKMCGEVEAAAAAVHGWRRRRARAHHSLATRPRLVSFPAGAGAATGVFEDKVRAHRHESSRASPRRPPCVLDARASTHLKQ
jgi:hypothetical protein